MVHEERIAESMREELVCSFNILSEHVVLSIHVTHMALLSIHRISCACLSKRSSMLALNSLSA